ncbi:hypothetical protein Tco_0491143 [Tanacetum coccineum]
MKTQRSLGAILAVLDISGRITHAPHWLTYDFPPHVREKLKRQWGSDWKGQAQKWFLFKLTGKDEEINLLGDGTEKPEFGEWTLSWVVQEQPVSTEEKLSEDFLSPHHVSGKNVNPANSRLNNDPLLSFSLS